VTHSNLNSVIAGYPAYPAPDINNGYFIGEYKVDLKWAIKTPIKCIIIRSE
jgi:hypothetical protein